MAETTITVNLDGIKRAVEQAVEKSIQQFLDEANADRQLLKKIVIAHDVCEDEELEELIASARERFGFVLRDDIDAVREEIVEGRNEQIFGVPDEDA